MPFKRLMARERVYTAWLPTAVELAFSVILRSLNISVNEHIKTDMGPMSWLSWPSHAQSRCNHHLERTPYVCSHMSTHQERSVHFSLGCTIITRLERLYCTQLGMSAPRHAETSHTAMHGSDLRLGVLLGKTILRS